MDSEEIFREGDLVYFWYLSDGDKLPLSEDDRLTTVVVVLPVEVSPGHRPWMKVLYINSLTDPPEIAMQIASAWQSKNSWKLLK